jgi:hypothetical protein
VDHSLLVRVLPRSSQLHDQLGGPPCKEEEQLGELIG